MFKIKNLILIFYFFVLITHTNNVYPIDMSIGYSSYSAFLNVSRYNESGTHVDRGESPHIAINFFGRDSIETGINFDVIAGFERFKFEEQYLSFQYYYYFSASDRYETYDIDGYYDLGTSVSGAFFYFTPVISFDFIAPSNYGDAIMSIGVGPALYFTEISGSIYLTDPCVENIFSNGQHSNPTAPKTLSEIELNCRKISLDINDQGTGAYGFIKIRSPKAWLFGPVLQFSVFTDGSDSSENKENLNVSFFSLIYEISF